MIPRSPQASHRPSVTPFSSDASAGGSGGPGEQPSTAVRSGPVGDGDGEANDYADVLQGAPLIMRWGDGAWKVPTTDSWQDERSLQVIVGDNPTLLPGVTGNEAATVLEFPIYDAGRVDILCVEQDGSLTVCEVKLRRNPEIRRQVLGQVLAYAAGLSAMTYGEVDREWAARSGASLAASVLGDDADPSDVSAFQDTVIQRLRSGRFRLVLVVDELTSELKRIIDYLARHTDSDVDLVALEVAYARNGELEVLVPRAWGVAASVRRPSSRASSSDATRVPLDRAAGIVQASEEAHTGAGALVEEILTALGPRLAYLYVGNPDRLAVTGCVVVADDPVPCQPLAIRPALRSPGIRVCFDWMRKIGEDRLEALLAQLESHPALAPLLAEVRTAQFRRRPLIPFSVLEDSSVRDAIVSGLSDALRPIDPSEDVVPVPATSFDRDRLHELMAVIPPGRWTTYGELARLSGTKGMPLGGHIKRCGLCPNAPRVLPDTGKPAEGFTRTDPTDLRTQRSELETEGITFLNNVADPTKRINGDELAALAHHHRST